MKQLLSIFLVFILFISWSFSQGVIILKQGDFKYSKMIDESVWSRLSKYENFQTMDSSLQWNYYWLNVMRKSPANFFKNYVGPFLDQFPDAISSYSKSLKADMRSMDSLAFLIPDAPLSKVAQAYGLDLLDNKLNLNHKNSQGEDFSKRISGITGLSCAAENVYKGSEDPLLALILLLIDHNVVGLGHRKNLLDQNFNVVGLSFFKKGKEGSILVQEFGCR